MILNFLNFRQALPVQPDIELGHQQQHQEQPFINGFPSVASFMDKDPDRSLSIFPSFYKLSSRSLMYMEAELFELQQQQHVMDIQDSYGNGDVLQCFRSWKQLRKNTDPRSMERKEMIRNIQSAVKEYQEALVLQETILKMGKPQPKTVEALKRWLGGTSEGPEGRDVPSFQGFLNTRLNDENDLVALHPAFEQDWLSRIVDVPYLRYFCLDTDVDESIAIYSMRKVNRAAKNLSMVIASLLLIVTIVTLYLVKSSNVRLGLICAFTLVFALSIHLLTNARRAELFVATAAYAAVLVVFVSGDLGASGSKPS